VLADDPNPETRSWSRACVLESGNPERNDPVLLRRFLTDSSQGVRRLALQRLAELTDEQYSEGCGSLSDYSENPVRTALCISKTPQALMSPVIVKGFLSTDPVIQLFSVRAALTLLDSKPETLFVTRLAEEDRPTLVERARPFVQDAMSPLRISSRVIIRKSAGALFAGRPQPGHTCPV